ncbi:hypothetical protein R4Y45_07390 [Holzapfeliella sp. He02]|uniref:Uncharacterized protein n=1 Tax=Holzapfeliella saturejae TaxID=3082953 RepID=A0ABU8SI40_9LACO
MLEKLRTEIEQKTSKRASSLFDILLKRMDSDTFTTTLTVNSELDNYKKKKAYQQVILAVNELSKYQVMIKNNLDSEVYNLFIANYLSDRKNKSVNIMLNSDLIKRLESSDNAQLELIEEDSNYIYIEDWD